MWSKLPNEAGKLKAAKATYNGYRTQCTDCDELYVSAAGSEEKGDCKPAYDQHTDANTFCSVKKTGQSVGMPLIPILDEDGCNKAVGAPAAVCVSCHQKHTQKNPSHIVSNDWGHALQVLTFFLGR